MLKVKVNLQTSESEADDLSNENFVAFTMFEETDLSYEFKMPPNASSCYYHMICLGEVPRGHLSDVNEVRNHHAVLEAAHSCPDLFYLFAQNHFLAVLTGHQDNPEFALAMCPTEPFVLSGVVLWSIQDHITTVGTYSKSSGSIIKQTSEGGDKSESPYVGLRGVYHTHDDTKPDLQDQRRAETNGRGTAPVGSLCRGLSRACFFSRTVASGRGFGLSWTQAELRPRTLITDRERLKLSLIGVFKPEHRQEQFRVLRD
ncbi:hypothetical protein F2Q70_00011096 [Brassica cretica]|uniref:Uncharacterized protein n=1 Tax=Brassica cretica TaxID=69181 RepID=A0A8S9M170_BRACR|nr:hypothetical protein F2Q70_00011096 [Brassica cretica]